MNQSTAPDHGLGNIRVWLDCHAYARRVLLRPGDDPWEGATKFLAFFSQEQSLLKPDVAVIDARALYDAWLERHPDVRAGLAGKRRPSQAVRRLLELPGPRALLVEVVEAALSQLRGRVPLIVSSPSPRHWLAYANAATSTASIPSDTDSIEDAAMYLADLIRCLAEAPITGLMLEERHGEPLTDVQHYRPVINVAKHYRWLLALRTDGDSGASDIATQDVPILIGPTRPARADGSWGMDVSRSLWSGQDLPEAQMGQFYFAAIPQEQRPEQVLDCLAKLRGKR